MTYRPSFKHISMLFIRDRYEDRRSPHSQLKAFFSVDAVLPYTFMSLLTVGNLVYFLQIDESSKEQMEFPLEAVLACARHHLKINQQNWVSFCSSISEGSVRIFSSQVSLPLTFRLA